MSTAAVLPRRRRAVTYGKWSHKTSSIGDAAARVFVEATQTSRSDKRPAKSIPHPRVGSQNQSAASANSNSSPGIGRKHAVQVDEQLYPASTAAAASNNHDLFDFPESEDESDLDQKSGYGARKKRKMGPLIDQNRSVLVYDDDSLQRHIAAQTSLEAQWVKSSAKNSEGSPHLHRSGNNIHENLRLRLGQEKISGYKTRQRHDYLDDHSGHSKIGKKDDPDDTINSLHEDISATDLAVNPVKKDQRVNRSTRAITPNGNFLRAENNEINSHEDDDDPRAMAMEQEEKHGPQTPPRLLGHGAVANTPRQRESWSRLLAESAQAGSPSHLNVSGLEIVDHNTNADNKRTPRKFLESANQVEETATGLRKKRIIDTLLPPGPEKGILAGNPEDDMSSMNSTDDSGSETSAWDDAGGLQSPPNVEIRSGTVNPREQMLAPSAQLIPPSHAAGHKVTYAQQRSYLTENSSRETAVFDTSFGPDPKVTQAKRKTYVGTIPDPQSSRGSPASFNDAPTPDIGTMRSIHELREAGGTVRMSGELESIFDDLEAQKDLPKSPRRTTLLQLATILDEPANCRLLVDKGLEKRFLACFDPNQDMVANSLFVMILLQLIAHSAMAPLISQNRAPNVVSFLIGLLQFDHDLIRSVKLREYNMSKLAQQEYANVCKTMLCSSLWRVRKPPVLSCRILSLQCLEYLSRWTCEAGFATRIIPVDAIDCIVTYSVPPTGSSLAASSTCVELAIQILESCIISSAANYQVFEGLSAEARARLVGILPNLSTWASSELDTLREPILRFYLNITNQNPHLCEAFVTAKVADEMFSLIFSHFEPWEIQRVKVPQPLQLDTVILSLGCLINFAESSDAMVRSVKETDRGIPSHLDRLLSVFQARWRVNVEVSLILRNAEGADRDR